MISPATEYYSHYPSAERAIKQAEHTISAWGKGVWIQPIRDLVWARAEHTDVKAKYTDMFQN